MKIRTIVSVIILLLAFDVSIVPAFSQAQTNTSKYQKDVESVDAIIKAYYEVVSGPKGQERDWKRDEFLHHPSAKIWIIGENGEGKPYINSMSIKEYHASSSGLVQQGFFEVETKREVQKFGHMIHVWSTYSWSSKENGPKEGGGINSIQLYHDGNRYWIMSWTYDSERPNNPLPKTK